MSVDKGCRGTQTQVARALEGCTAEEARRLVWAAVEAAGLDPQEVLGLDVDDDVADDEALS